MVTEFGEGDLFQILEDDTTLPESEVNSPPPLSLSLPPSLSLSPSLFFLSLYLYFLSISLHFPSDSSDCCPAGFCPLLLTFKEDTS